MPGSTPLVARSASRSGSLLRARSCWPRSRSSSPTWRATAPCWPSKAFMLKTTPRRCHQALRNCCTPEDVKAETFALNMMSTLTAGASGRPSRTAAGRADRPLERVSHGALARGEAVGIGRGTGSGLTRAGPRSQGRGRPIRASAAVRFGDPSLGLREFAFALVARYCPGDVGGERRDRPQGERQPSRRRAAEAAFKDTAPDVEFDQTRALGMDRGVYTLDEFKRLPSRSSTLGSLFVGSRRVHRRRRTRRPGVHEPPDGTDGITLDWRCRGRRSRSSRERSWPGTGRTSAASLRPGTPRPNGVLHSRRAPKGRGAYSAGSGVERAWQRPSGVGRISTRR